MDFTTVGSGTNLAILIGVILFGMITMGIILARLYTRASKEISFVRTGMGGQGRGREGREAPGAQSRRPS